MRKKPGEGQNYVTTKHTDCIYDNDLNAGFLPRRWVDGEDGRHAYVEMSYTVDRSKAVTGVSVIVSSTPKRGLGPDYTENMEPTYRYIQCHVNQRHGTPMLRDRLKLQRVKRASGGAPVRMHSGDLSVGRKTISSLFLTWW